MGSLLGWLSLSNISILISSLWVGHRVGQPRFLLNRFLENQTFNSKVFLSRFQKKILTSFWIMVRFSLNSSLYQIFRSWKPNFGHRSFKRVSTTRITQPDHCSCWLKVSNMLFLTARQQYVLKTYLRLSWFSQTSF